MNEVGIEQVMEAKQQTSAQRLRNRSSSYKEKQQAVEQPRFSGKYQVGTWRKHNGQWVVRVVFNLGRMPKDEVVMVLKANGRSSYVTVDEPLEVVELDEQISAGYFAIKRKGR